MGNVDRLERLNKIFHEVTGKNIEMKTFDDRILFQKVIYFLNNAGVNFDYKFSWYIRGPYSSVLASEGFQVAEARNSGAKIGDNFKLEAEDMKILKRVGLEFPEMANQRSELYASILFFARQGEKLGTIADTIASLKPWYNKGEIIQSIDKLKTSKLFSQLLFQ